MLVALWHGMADLYIVRVENSTGEEDKRWEMRRLRDFRDIYTGETLVLARGREREIEVHLSKF